ncbi:hypothetical protein Dimus_019241 [Dionaea muscipula]
MSMSSSSNKDDHPLSFLNRSSSPITLSELDTYNNNNNNNNAAAPTGSASSSLQSDTFLGGGSADGSATGSVDVEFGFSRLEFQQSSVVGTVQFFERHVFLCYKNPRNWPPRIEAAEFDRLPRLLSAALAARKGSMKKETRLTICEGRDGTETSNGDVLIFPDMIRYRRLTHFDIDTFVEEVLIKDVEWLPGTPEKLKGSHIFVCCHGSRDRRCGVCGPPLVMRFKEEVESHGLLGKVSVSPCSHIGGHKYAGNVIIFGSNVDRQITGHWYGYVAPDDVPALLEQHIIKGEIVERLWRGQMGLSEDDQKKAQETRLQSCGGTGTGTGTGTNIIKQPSLPNATCAPPPTCDESQPEEANANGCCQFNGNGDACCQNHKLSEEGGVARSSIQIQPMSTTTVKKSKKSNSHKGLPGARKVCAMPTWFESWEQEDTYAALAVVCAAMSVGIAYSCYKQSV